MKRLHTGIILLDGIDILCLSFSTSSIIAFGFKKYKSCRKSRATNEDLIVDQLKRDSPINIFSEENTPLKLPLMRGGDTIKTFSLIIRSKKLTRIIIAIVNARKNQKKLRLLRDILFILNRLLAISTGLCIGAGGTLSYTHVVLIALPSTVGGFIIGIISANPLVSAALPIAILFGRGIEDVPDPYEKCKFICKAAENFHNQQLMLEMKNMGSEVPLLYTEQPLSLLERYRLREAIKSTEVRERVQHFSEFIKKFPECLADPEDVYQEVIGNVQKIPIKR
jgi:hypothetical protein